MIVKVLTHRVGEIKDLTNDHVFKVNRHRLEPFLEMPNEEDMECLFLHVPLSLE